MAHLSLVKKVSYKNLSYLKEEQRHSQNYLEIDNLELLRGSLTELTGEESAGKTSLVSMLISSLAQDGEVCCIVDLNEGFSPNFEDADKSVLENILWIRCGENVEHAFKATDYLIQAKNLGLIWLNLSQTDTDFIPNSYWYRFKNKIKDSPTLLIVTSEKSILGSASSQSYHFEKQKTIWSGLGSFKLLKEFHTNLNTRKPFLIKPELTKIKARY